MIDAPQAMGIPPDDSRIIADVLITSDLWGIRSHGVAHLKMYHERILTGLQLPVAAWTIVRDTPTTAVIDGGNGMGMVIAYHAMQMAIDKARGHGLGAVAVRSSSHYGIAGYYANMAVRQGRVGISFTNAHPSIAPTFGVEPLLGTNPIAVGIPTDEPYPFLFDAATSIIPRGKIEVAARANKPLPEGGAIRHDGTLATDSNGLIAQMNSGLAALLPLGGMGEASVSEPIRAVERALDILLCFSRQTPQLSMTQIAERLGMNKSAVHRHLATLERMRFVQRDPVTGMYQLGIRLLQMAYLTLEGSDLRRVAAPFLRSLCDEYRDAA